MSNELGDRLAIADLVHGYAQRVDNRDPEGVGALFVPDGLLTVHAKVGSPEPTSVHRGRSAITAAIAAMSFQATCHMIGSQTVHLEGDRASGETRGVAHHVKDDTDWAWYLHYLDTFVRDETGWLFAARDLWVDFIASGPLTIRS